MNQAIAKEVEQKASSFPRITPEHVESVIVSETYHQFPGTTLTVCVLTLANGFAVTGESACAAPENFNDEEIGRKIARDNAKAKIWQLEGYMLRYGLHHVSHQHNIARVAHEVNRAYCKALGDDSQPAWDDAPDWQKQSALNGVAFHLTDPRTSVAASHENWMAQKVLEGWTYGPVKNAAAKTHPCMVPFDTLPVEQQAKDYLFQAVVHALGFPLADLPIT